MTAARSRKLDHYVGVSDALAWVLGLAPLVFPNPPASFRWPRWEQGTADETALLQVYFDIGDVEDNIFLGGRRYAWYEGVGSALRWVRGVARRPPIADHVREVYLYEDPPS